MDLSKAKLQSGIKAYALYLTSEKTAKIMNTTIEDDMIKIGKKTWKIDDAIPLFIETSILFGMIKTWIPMYILSYNNPKPLSLKTKYDDKLSPEVLQTLIDQNLVKTLMSPQSMDLKPMVFIFMLVFLAGAGIGFIGSMLFGG